MEVPVLNQSGQKVGVLKIDEESLGGTINPALIKQAYVRYHANRRQGSARTKSRARVEGSTRKLYRQKGTGNARPGPIRTPIRKGGGHAHSKTRGREAFRPDMPVKMRRLANRNALLAKLIDNEVRVLDSLELSAPKTRDFRKLLDACKIDRTCLVALGPASKAAALGARNIPDVSTIPAQEMTCFEMLNHRYLVISKSDLESWLTGPSSKTDKSAKQMRKRDAA